MKALSVCDGMGQELGEQEIGGCSGEQRGREKRGRTKATNAGRKLKNL